MSAHTLTRERFNRRLDRVAKYAAGMGIDSLDSNQYDQAEALDDLLGGTDPDRIEQKLEEVRRHYQMGLMDLEGAVDQLVQSCSPAPTGTPDASEAAKLARIFRLALSQEIPFAAAAKGAMGNGTEMDFQENTPNVDGRSMPSNEVRRMARDGNRVRHYARTGEPLRAGDLLDFTKQDLDAALKIMDRRKCDFNTACKLMETR